MRNLILGTEKSDVLIVINIWKLKLKIAVGVEGTFGGHSLDTLVTLFIVSKTMCSVLKVITLKILNLRNLTNTQTKTPLKLTKQCLENAYTKHKLYEHFSHL